MLCKDFGQPEYAEYFNPEEPLDDHLTRPDEDVASSDNEMTMSYDYHNENHDSTNHPDPQEDATTDNYVESYVDHYTTGMDNLEGSMNDISKVQQILNVLRLSNEIQKISKTQITASMSHTLNMKLKIG